MFSSGLVKLLSGDPTWRNLTALEFHYETQPLPTWIGWYAHQLPARFQQLSTFVMFTVELALPFLIFMPRRIRRIPCVAFVVLQILIFLTGNYCFFNLLTIALCLVLIDDGALNKLFPRRLLGLLPAATTNPHPTDHVTFPQGSSTGKRWPIQFTFPLTCIAIFMPLIQIAYIVHPGISFPRELIKAYTWISPFRSFNHYGLFQVMTTNRMEIVIEGSNDGITWFEYEFKYKPGNVLRRPAFVAPHQPRLDWQMWFAALSDYRYNPWLVELCIRLLNDSPNVIDLLQNNPFPGAPPKYLRAMLYQYHFTDVATRRRTGAWWRREPKGLYLPVLRNKSTPN